MSWSPPLAFAGRGVNYLTGGQGVYLIGNLIASTTLASVPGLPDSGLSAASFFSFSASAVASASGSSLVFF